MKTVHQRASAVIFTGPESYFTPSGDEVPMWYVYLCNVDGDPVGKTYRCSSYKGADELSAAIARDRRIELVHEANRD